MTAAGRPLVPTLRTLGRSFASLTEWLEVPEGVVAQIIGHKPSATAKKHYKRRPLDLLRVHHQTIESWILEQAGIELGAATARWATISSPGQTSIQGPPRPDGDPVGPATMGWGNANEGVTDDTRLQAASTAEETAHFTGDS